MPPKPRNGLIQTLFFALFGVLISLLGYNLKTLADDVKDAERVAAANSTEIARREANYQRIPKIEEDVSEIKETQIKQGAILKAIARKVGAD